ncbi:hypothetical protein [Streptomyces sp. NBC_00878]|uniref:hypothetical protein n=1 Tax=Streptomyces sp. NBC_00878 TaxID=2975854 RepID=UPI002256C954|nr:hypothetical protein [Streptomyces sp. NBC_00878]MCX4909697.1 hypothetical protein [Streptomyces sp. NBC_00878]
MSYISNSHISEWANRNAAAGEEHTVWGSGSATAPVLATPAAGIAAAAVTAAVVVRATADIAAGVGTAFVGGDVSMEGVSTVSRSARPGGSVEALLLEASAA